MFLNELNCISFRQAGLYMVQIVLYNYHWNVLHQDPACIRCPCGARMSELLFHQTGFKVVTQLHLTAKQVLVL